MSMSAYELPISCKAINVSGMKGECFFLDGNGDKLVVDYIYEDDEGNLILAEFENPNIPKNKLPKK